MKIFIQTLNSVVAVLNIAMVFIFMWFFSMVLFGGMDGAAAITLVIDTLGQGWDLLCGWIGGLAL